MNKITFPRIGVDGISYSQDDIEIWYTNKVTLKITQRLEALILKLQEPPKVNIEYISFVQNVKDNLSILLLLKPIELENVVNIIDSEYKEFLLQKVNDNTLQTLILEAFNYKNFRKSILIELAKKLNIKTCPYCNMQFTLYAENPDHKEKKLARFQFDHFYDKITYPILSMSLYNLIPSCAICNQGKSQKVLPLIFNPYYADIHEQFDFHIEEQVDYLLMGAKIKEMIKVELHTKNATEDEIKEYEQTFHLKTLYCRHGDIVQEVFDKVYVNEYYNNLDNFKFLQDVNPNYLKRLWIGTYTNIEEIHKRPMTKFIQDIWEQATSYEKLKLIGKAQKH